MAQLCWNLCVSGREKGPLKICWWCRYWQQGRGISQPKADLAGRFSGGRRQKTLMENLELKWARQWPWWCPSQSRCRLSLKNNLSQVWGTKDKTCHVEYSEVRSRTSSVWEGMWVWERRFWKPTLRLKVKVGLGFMSRWNVAVVLEIKKGEMTFSSTSVRAGSEFRLCHPLCNLEHGTEAVVSQVPPLFKKRT